MSGYAYTDTGLRRMWWKCQDMAFAELGLDSSARAAEIMLEQGVSYSDLHRLVDWGEISFGMLPPVPEDGFADNLAWALKPTGNLRLPRDPQRALADMQAAITDINNHKGLSDELPGQKA